jgi:2-methylcitrate dehydratase PrpD
VPAGFAVALRERSAGVDFLDALVRGYEAMIRVGRSVGSEHYRYWHNTSTCGPFGAAAAAGGLLGLTAQQMLWALGNAGTQSAGPWQCRLEGTMSKQLHTGRAAHAGVVAADLARCGFTGPALMLEGPLGFYAAMCPNPAPEQVLANADVLWLIEETSFKPWPACRHTHAAIDAMLEVRREIAAADVAAITVQTFGDAVSFCDNPSPRTPLEAKFSLQHCAAVVLLDGPPPLEAFEPEALVRDDVAALREKVSLQVAEPYASDYPQHFGAGITIRLVSGREVSAQAADALGDPENPIDAQAVEDKARMLMNAAGVEARRIEDIVVAALALSCGGTPTELAALLP